MRQSVTTCTVCAACGSLGRNALGPRGGSAIARALRVLPSLTSLQYVGVVGLSTASCLRFIDEHKHKGGSFSAYTVGFVLQLVLLTAMLCVTHGVCVFGCWHG